VISTLDRYIAFLNKTCSKNNIILSHIDQIVDESFSKSLNKERITVDLHIHSIYSDGIATPLEIAKIGKARGLSAIGVTDHLYNGKDQKFGVTDRTFKSYFKACHSAAQISKLCVVPGLELDTNEGHLVVLFPDYNPPIDILKLKQKNSIVHLSEKIHELGGVVIAAHIDRKDGIGKLVFQYSNLLDSIEYGLRIPEYSKNTKFKTLNLSEVASSDSHSPSTIGSAYSEISNNYDISWDVRSIERLLESLRRRETKPQFLSLRRRVIALDHTRWMCPTYLSKRVFQIPACDKWLIGSKLNEF
jgi:predicted metal-dependent phosphoesterase TrpH